MVNQPTVAGMISFTGKVAIITGATRGIGLECARLIARLGGKVAVSSRKADACERVCRELTDQGYDAIAVPTHAARDADLAQLVAATMDKFGRLDVVIANAGINPTFDLLADLPDDSFARIMDLNLVGPLRLARHALPLIARQGGAMVMTSSVNAQAGMVGSGAYGISKAALEALTRQLAVEWGKHDIRINAVAPGTTRTDMVRVLTQRPGFIDTVKATTPLGRIAEPEDIAAFIVFLASDHARHMTGQVLTVDGGQNILRGPA